MGVPEDFDDKAHWGKMVEVLWSAYDDDDTGDLDHDQAKRMFNAIFSGSPPGEFNRKFALMDTNDDGRISKEEMISYVKLHIDDYEAY